MGVDVYIILYSIRGFNFGPEDGGSFFHRNVGILAESQSVTSRTPCYVHFQKIILVSVDGTITAPLRFPRNILSKTAAQLIYRNPHCLGPS
jgi:hypothetical protein